MLASSQLRLARASQDLSNEGARYNAQIFRMTAKITELTKKEKKKNFSFAQIYRLTYEFAKKERIQARGFEENKNRIPTTVHPSTKLRGAFCI